jgi:hypothetical protein
MRGCDVALARGERGGGPSSALAAQIAAGPAFRLAAQTAAAGSATHLAAQLAVKSYDPPCRSEGPGDRSDNTDDED